MRISDWSSDVCSSDLYDATRRELDRNAIRFDAPYACAFFLCTGNGVYGDREIRAALAAIGENPPASPYRNILIRDGVMLVAGQDKGVMLKLLLAAIGGRGYAGVVVADRKCTRMNSRHSCETRMTSY